MKRWIISLSLIIMLLITLSLSNDIRAKAMLNTPAIEVDVTDNISLKLQVIALIPPP